MPKFIDTINKTIAKAKKDGAYPFDLSVPKDSPYYYQPIGGREGFQLSREQMLALRPKTAEWMINPDNGHLTINADAWLRAIFEGADELSPDVSSVFNNLECVISLYFKHFNLSLYFNRPLEQTTVDMINKEWRIYDQADTQPNLLGVTSHVLGLERLTSLVSNDLHTAWFFGAMGGWTFPKS